MQPQLQVEVRRRGAQGLGPSPGGRPAQAWPELPGEALQALRQPSPAPRGIGSPGGSDMDLANTTTNLTGMLRAGSLPALPLGTGSPGPAPDFLSRDLIDLQPTPPPRGGRAGPAAPAQAPVAKQCA